MAKLIVYRGDTLDREVDLTEATARVGRGDQNEIVLTDPAKSVSRFHAEIRFDQGRFTIVDLNSQNGTWVAGRRVQYAMLEPGVPVVLGTYRLVLKKEAQFAAEEAEATVLMPAPPPKAAAPPAAPPVAPSSAATMVGAAIPPPLLPAAVAAPKPAAPPPAPPAPPPAPRPQPAPVKVEPPKPTPPAPAKPAPAAAAAKAPLPAKKGLSKWAWIGGFAVVALIVMAAAVFLTPLKYQVPGFGGSQPTEPAVVTPPAVAPPAVPAPEASTPPASEPPATPPPVSTPVAASAPPAVQASTPPAVPAPVVEPAAKPAPKAERPARTPAPVAPATPAGRGGRGTPAPAPNKSINVSQTVEDGRSAMIKGDFLGAIASFESVLKVDPKNATATDLLGVARGGAKNASQQAVEAGTKAETGGDYTAAATQYDKALQLDPDSTTAPQAISRMKARMQGEGEDAFKRARQYDAMGRGKDAIPMYEKAVRLLPPDHASVAVAKERLAALKGGL